MTQRRIINQDYKISWISFDKFGYEKNNFERYLDYDVAVYRAKEIRAAGKMHGTVWIELVRIIDEREVVVEVVK